MYESVRILSTRTGMISPPTHSSFWRVPGAAAPRDNGAMTTSTTDRPVISEWHVERIRVWWSRIRDWDADHQVWSDAGVVCVLLVACLSFPGGFAQQGRQELMFQIALILPLVWRRRAPSLVFSIIAGVALVQWVTSVPLPADAALLVALFTLAVHATPKRAILGAIIVLGGAVMASVRWIPGGNVVKSLVFLTGLLVAALFVGIALRTWRSYMDSLRERTKRLEHESKQQAMLATATERSRIAREMHDVIAHSLSIMVTLADGAVAIVDAHPTRAKEAMVDVSATGRLALTDMRHLLGVLRPNELTLDRQPQPQLSGLPRLLQGVRATGLKVELVQVGTPFEIPPGVELTMFRIVQESLTNILKHAQQPSTAHVTLTFDAPFVDVHVTDDGQSVGTCTEGHGLSGMRERSTFSGGTFTAGPRQEGGWEVAACVRADQ
jgi:signal transduction histidine kinase